jgi:DNA-binding CsgD family transcriptional regulator/PAS domain-containing protein
MRFDCDLALTLAGHLYDCSMDPAHWPVALAAFVDAFECTGGALVQASRQDPPVVLRETWVGQRPSEAQLARYRALEAHDPRVSWASERFGEARASNLELPDHVLRASALYQEVLRPAGIEYTLALPELVDEHVVATLSLTRDAGKPPFTLEEVSALQSMRSHLLRALRTQHRLGAAEGLGRDLRDALQRLPVGVLIVAPTGRVRFVSEAAERIVACQDGLALQDGALVARATEADERLQRLLQSTLAAARAEQTQLEDTLVIPRPSGARAYEVLVTPLRADRLAVWPEEPSAMVIIHDPAAAGTLPWELVQRLYGLSPAEAKLSVALAGGWAIKDYAERSAISVETARSQLKAAMAKTRTHRQAELIRRILTGPAAYTLMSAPGS